MYEIIRFAQKEDFIRWAMEFTDNRILQMLWYPSYQEMSDLGLYLFFHN